MEYNYDSIPDLSTLIHLRILVVQLWRYFPLGYIGWLDGLIGACSSPSETLETFIIRVEYSCRTIEVEEVWENVLHALLDDVCPSLKTLTILITSDEGHEVTSWVNWFTKFRTLRSKRGTDVAVLVKTDLSKLLHPNMLKHLTSEPGELQYANDARWECVACCNDKYQWNDSD